MPIQGCYLIAIEGPDKVGKETQSKLLAKSLPGTFTKTFHGQDGKRLVKIQVEREQIPYDDGQVGTYKKIYDMLKTGEARAYPEAFQTIHAMNRISWQANVLPQLTRYTDVIVLDRWNTSAWAYGLSSGLSPAFLKCILLEICEPDIVFVFEGSPFDTPDREDDSYEGDRDFMNMVRHHYKIWTRDNPHLAIPIDANRDMGTIQREIILHCKERLVFQ